MNVVPKRATDAPVTSVTASLASRSVLGAHVDIGRRFGADREWGLRFNGILRAGDTAIDGQSTRLGVGTLALDYRGDRLRTSLDAGYVDQDTDVPTGAAGFGFASELPILPAPKLDKQIYQDWEYARAKSVYGLAKFEYDIDPAWTAYGGIGFRRYDQDVLSTDIYVTGTDGSAVATAYYSPIQGNAATAQLGVRGEFSTGAVDHEINLNASYLFQDMNQESNYYGFYVFDTNIYDAPTVARPSTDGFSSHPPRYWEIDAPAVTLADTMSLLDDRLRITLGARYQKIKVDVFAPDGSISQAYDDQAVTPAFGVVAKPVDNLSVYANYIEGLQQGPVAWQGTANAGEVFPPVRTKQMEVGVKYDFGAFALTSSVFQITKPSSIITTDASGASVFSVDGEQRNRGAELNLFGEIADNLRLLGGVAYTEGKLTGTDNGLYDGNTAIGVPRWQGNVAAEWDPGFLDGVTLSGRAIATSAQYMDQSNARDLPGWTRFDFGAAYSSEVSGKPVVLRAAIENAFGKDYWTGVSDGWVTMGEPRTLKVSATVDF